MFSGFGFAEVSGLAGTFGAEALQHVVDAVQCEAVGQFDYGRGNVGEAESPVAARAVEVGVQVVDAARAAFAAYGILEGARPVVDAVYQVAGEEQGERAEDGGFVHRVQHVLQVGQRHGASGPFHGSQYQYPYGRGLYLPLGQQFQAFLFVHTSLLSVGWFLHSFIG